MGWTENRLRGRTSPSPTAKVSAYPARDSNVLDSRAGPALRAPEDSQPARPAEISFRQTQTEVGSPMITLAEHSHRRAALLAALRQHAPDPVVVVQGGPKESAHARFRQVNDFMYLCPVETPHAYLVIDGRGGDDTSHLFLPYQPPSRLKSEGPLVNAADP